MTYSYYDGCKPVTFATDDDINHVNARLSKHADRIGKLEFVSERLDKNVNVLITDVFRIEEKLDNAARAGDRELTAAESRIAVLETQVAQLQASLAETAKHSHQHLVPQVQWVPYPGVQG